jgi:putative addiction module killer protein
MEPTPRTILHYLTADRRDPYDEWFTKLKDPRIKGVILSRLHRVQFGNFGDSAPVGDGVHELRIDFGLGYRVYYGLDGKTIVVLLAAGDKGTQAMDIRKAKQRWRDYNA